MQVGKSKQWANLFQAGIAAAALLSAGVAQAETPYELKFSHPGSSKVTVEVASDGSVFVGNSLTDVITIGDLTGHIVLSHPGQPPNKPDVDLGDITYDVQLLLEQDYAIGRARVFGPNDYVKIVGGNPYIYATFLKENGQPVSAELSNISLGRLKKGTKLQILAEFLADAIEVGKVSGVSGTPAGGPDVTINFDSTITIGGLHLQLTLQNKPIELADNGKTKSGSVMAQAILLQSHDTFVGTAPKQQVSGNPLVSFIVDVKNSDPVTVFAIPLTQL